MMDQIMQEIVLCITQRTDMYGEEGKKRKWLWTLDVSRSEDYYQRVLWFGGEWSSHTSVVAHRRYSLGRELQLFNFSFGTQPAVGCFEPFDCISSC